ncbi:IclR family transcriptional regulator domain-containing protein [Streptomyces sp. NBC_01022]|uniref:IclR family transcriptional regulator domain-containing protein n=1 Tax=Streptomyces sp. NBC_01022 TaxID=2903723 RepID=UPI002DD9281A|nr:IclR family transcriptional regulator C-terminal domain-containing protein [Streptomyces sp. NBC_01022]WRZ79065.1 helix-turn-helix domain-containing protein [Streptomyces sp. NBC_01022]WRZ86613.1 helix-turn-helix domain-containing protein [Streptomyces sp. NBC_01022]
MPPPHPPQQTETPAPAEAVAPLMRGIAVLRRLTDEGGTMSPSAIERATSLARSTVDRITATLARMEYVRVDGRDVTLAPRLMELGNAYLSALRLPSLLGRRADALADELDESVSLAVGDGDGIRFIHQATRRRAMSLSFRIGDLLPAERTAPGPLLAAGWDAKEWQRWRDNRAADPEGLTFPAVPPRPPSDEKEFAVRAQRARHDGWALDDQLIEPGLVALAVPVRSPEGEVACLVSVVSHTSRHTAASLRDTLLPRVLAAAAAMEQDLRQAPPAVTPDSPVALASWTGASKQELGREFNESLARGLTVLATFGEGRDALTLTDVARATGLARATARRALITLEHLGYVTAEGRAHHLTPRVLALGYPPLSLATLPQIAQPHLAALTGQVQDSASLAVLVGDDVQYTGRVATRRIMNVNITVGTRFPAHATSMGRVLLAALPPAERESRLARTQAHALTPYTVTRPDELSATLDRVRADGHALVDEELEVGLRSVAVPVHDRRGTVVAAVNVAMHSSSRTLEECVTDVLPHLRAAAGRIEADLHITERYVRVPAM